MNEAIDLLGRALTLCDQSEEAVEVPLGRKLQMLGQMSSIEGNGQRVLVDPESLPFLSGSVIDFKDELIGARFAVENPNATSTCGCGTSFSI